MRVLVRTAPLARIDTYLSVAFGSEDIMWSIACSHSLTNMDVCVIMKNERTYKHEQQANGDRATSMPSCIDQTSIFKP